MKLEFAKGASSGSLVARLLGLVASLALMAAIAGWSMTIPAEQLDDGVQLTGALLTARGLRPNIDFYSVYPPLNAYVIGGAFQLLGESIISYRIVQTIAYFVIVGALAWYSRERLGALRPGLLLLILLATIGLCALQVLTALMWSLVALVLILKGRESEGRLKGAWFAAAGVAIGAVSVTRLNWALYLAAAWCVEAGVALLRSRTRGTLRALASEGLWIFAPALLTATIVLLAWGGSPVALLWQTVIVPSKTLVHNVLHPVPTKLNFTTVRWFLLCGLTVTPLSSLWLAVRARQLGQARASRGLLIAALVIAVLTVAVGHEAPRSLPALVIVQLGVLLAARRPLAALPAEEWFALVLLSLQTHYALSRPDGAHFYALLPSVVLLLLIARVHARGRALASLFAVAALLCGATLLQNTRLVANALRARRGAIAQISSLLRSEDAVLATTCATACAFVADPGQFAATSYIRERTRPTDRVFSGLQRNDPTLNNDVSGYWWMRRLPGTHHVMLQGGATTGEQYETEIVNELVSNDVRWLLLWASLPAADAAPPTAPLGVLDRFIREHFVRAATFGDYEVWQEASAAGQPSALGVPAPEAAD